MHACQALLADNISSILPSHVRLLLRFGASCFGVHAGSEGLQQTTDGKKKVLCG